MTEPFVVTGAEVHGRTVDVAVESGEPVASREVAELTQWRRAVPAVSPLGCDSAEVLAEWVGS
ncbi:MAG: hypothetical protein GX643_14650 [Acidimicrobiales bacterium]|nr:hypothetical protein [Acidimicrobiales bacterium]